MVTAAGTRNQPGSTGGGKQSDHVLKQPTRGCCEAMEDVAYCMQQHATAGTWAHLSATLATYAKDPVDMSMNQHVLLNPRHLQMDSKDAPSTGAATAQASVSESYANTVAAATVSAAAATGVVTAAVKAAPAAAGAADADASAKAAEIPRAVAGRVVATATVAAVAVEAAAAGAAAEASATAHAAPESAVVPNWVADAEMKAHYRPVTEGVQQQTQAGVNICNPADMETALPAIYHNAGHAATSPNATTAWTLDVNKVRDTLPNGQICWWTVSSTAVRTQSAIWDAGSVQPSTGLSTSLGRPKRHE